VLADSGNFDQLSEMCNQTRVVMSTVGPYMIYGTLLVNACALYGTDYADITGEVGWTRENARKFQSMAIKSGARIMSLCGCDSVPWDICTFMVNDELKTKHGERLESIEFFNHGEGGFSGGTIATMFHACEQGVPKGNNIARTDDPFFTVPGQKTGNGFMLQNNNCKIINYDWSRGVWTGFAIMAVVNVEVVEKSNCMLGYKDGLKYSEAAILASPFMGYVMYVVLAILGTIPFCPPLSWVARKFVLPKQGEGPSEEVQKTGFLEIVGEGKGDKGSVVNCVSTFKGDPGYSQTARMLGETGLCFVFNNEELRLGGGMHTTASGLGKVLLKRLTDTGTTFNFYNPKAPKVKQD
jgi:short subunit dehydrogenase-like uncharacterized protein